MSVHRDRLAAALALAALIGCTSVTPVVSPTPALSVSPPISTVIATTAPGPTGDPTSSPSAASPLPPPTPAVSPAPTPIPTPVGPEPFGLEVSASLDREVARNRDDVRVTLSVRNHDESGHLLPCPAIADVWADLTGVFSPRRYRYGTGTVLEQAKSGLLDSANHRRGPAIVGLKPASPQICSGPTIEVAPGAMISADFLWYVGFADGSPLPGGRDPVPIRAAVADKYALTVGSVAVRGGSTGRFVSADEAFDMLVNEPRVGDWMRLEPMSTWQAAAFRVRHSRWQLRVRRVGLGCCVEHARVVVDPASGHVTVVRLSTTPFGRPMAASTFYDGLELRLIASRRDLTDGQLMRFRLVVRNHNDHEYWYWYICAPSLDIPITIDVDPRAGRQWTGRLGELKRRLLTQDGGRIRISAGGDIGGGDCAEPSLYSIAAHGTIIRDFAWRPFSVGPGERNVTATGELALAGASAVAVHPFETTHEMQTSLVLRVAPGRNDYLAPAALVDRLLADERISTVVRGIPVGDWRDAWLGIYRGTWTFGLEWREKNASGHYAFHHIEATLDAIDGSISHIYRY